MPTDIDSIEKVHWLFNQGALAMMLIAVLAFLIIAARRLYYDLFSRKSDCKGLLTLKFESAVAKDQKMCEFMDALTDRDEKRDTMCQRHNEGLIQISTTLAQHHGVALAMKDKLDRDQQVALHACKITRVLSAKVAPEVYPEISAHCDRIERLLHDSSEDIS
jgi:hypothetical protein